MTRKSGKYARESESESSDSDSSDVVSHHMKKKKEKSKKKKSQKRMLSKEHPCNPLCGPTGICYVCPVVPVSSLCSTGPIGQQGITGEQGPTGPTGQQGITGEQGPTGPTGQQGITGEQGPTGQQGSNGPTGEQGPTGQQGFTGSMGPKGFTGPLGPIGPEGPEGPEGPQGSCDCICTTYIQDFSNPFGPSVSTGEQGPIILYQIPNVLSYIVYGFTLANIPLDLYIRTGETPSHENGIGFALDINNEINPLGYVQIDLADLIRLRTIKCGNPTLKIGSIQETEGFIIYGSNLLGVIGLPLYTYINTTGAVGAEIKEIVIPSYNTTDSSATGDLYKYGVTPFRYISVTSTLGNVTLNQLTFSLCSC